MYFLSSSKVPSLSAAAGRESEVVGDSTTQERLSGAAPC